MIGWVVAGWLASLALAKPDLRPASTCSLTRVDTFTYDCGLRGWVRDPYLIRNVAAKTTTACAAKCMADKTCKSFRYVEGVTECYLYSKFLVQMDTDFDNYQTGLLYDRECYSANCQTIAACKAAAACPFDDIDEYHRSYDQYACGYGVTAKPFKYYSTTNNLDGSLSTCDALRKCAGFESFGSFDVHWHIPSQQWVCIGYHDLGFVGTSYGFSPALRDERISHNRFNVPNSTVGDAYGFWMDYYYQF